MSNQKFNVRCVSDPTTSFTVGKVYHVEDGVIVSDDGHRFMVWSKCCRNNTFEHLDGWFRPAAIHFELVSSEKIVITHDGKTTTATMYLEDGTKKVATAKCAPEDEFEFRIGAEIAMARLVDKLVYSNFDIVRVVFREGGQAYSYKTRMKTAKVGMTITVPVGQKGKEANATVVEVITGDEYNGEFNISAMKEIDIVEAPKYYNGKVVCIDKLGVNRNLYTIGKIYQFEDGVLTSDNGTTTKDWGNKPFKSFEDFSEFTFSKFIEIVE